MPEVAIIDYGMGNLRSVAKGFERVGAEAVVTARREDILAATHLVLPGVGAFRACMEGVERLGLTDVIREFIATGRPFLGICLGLQLLFEESEEGGIHRGLGIIKGRVKGFTTDMREPGGAPLKVPHMGWNTIKIKKKGSALLEGIPEEAYFYFVHSYYVVPDRGECVLTTTDYGMEFTSSIERGNIFGVQFHPEKSQSVGLKLLENFSRL